MTLLTDALARVRLFYDPTREPLRRSVYTALIGIVALAATAGIVSGSLALGLAGPLAAILAVPAVEKARSKVTPVIPKPRRPDAWRTDTVEISTIRGVR